MKAYVYTHTMLKTYFSPFKLIIPKFYIGKVAIGTPYFLPRKWVKMTEEDCKETLAKDLKRAEDNDWKFIDHNTRTWQYYKNYKKAIPKKIGFDFVALGWKTKWSEKDIRHEWSPIWSFVFFKWQIALMFVPKHQSFYWECWLTYELLTDKSKSVKERIVQAREINPCIWISYKNEEKIPIDYWNLILKKKYLI